MVMKTYAFTFQSKIELDGKELNIKTEKYHMFIDENGILKVILGYQDTQSFINEGKMYMKYWIYELKPENVTYINGQPYCVINEHILYESENDEDPCLSCKLGKDQDETLLMQYIRHNKDKLSPLIFKLIAYNKKSLVSHKTKQNESIADFLSMIKDDLLIASYKHVLCTINHTVHYVTMNIDGKNIRFVY